MIGQRTRESQAIAALGRNKVIGDKLLHAKERGLMRVLGQTLAAPLTFWFCAPAHAENAQTPSVIAIAPFDYKDTSGEIRDQRKEHEERLQAFLEALKQDLAATGKYRIISLECKDAPCSDPSQVAEAQRNGADAVIFGSIQKMSTLIGWIKVVAVDTGTKNPVFERFLTFRGDNGEAWSRAEKFVAQELASATLKK
jgi:hypothetical protein